jgi:hypothetical protein
MSKGAPVTSESDGDSHVNEEPRSSRTVRSYAALSSSDEIDEPATKNRPLTRS